MKVRDYKELWKSDKENVFVFYSQFDMGKKYKVYRKVSYDGFFRAEYVDSFCTMSEAINYAKNIFDRIVER